jgi:RNA polymerase sigma-70 factor (ECF subfamily)
MDNLTFENSEFAKTRNRLFSVAYRMLGSKADAEDMIQETYLRWHQAKKDEIRSPEAWLVSVLTRLCIDRLRSATLERETYTGPWLPEPLFAEIPSSPEENLELAADLSMAFMVLLERLAPVERAAFLLHDVFDFEYPEVSRILEKSEAACRQVVHRARERVRRDRPRFHPTRDELLSLVERFNSAVSAGDEETVLSMFAEDATLTSDGGSKVNAARKVIVGRQRITRLFLVLDRKLGGRMTRSIVNINGEPGLVTYLDGKPLSATSFEMDGERIAALYHVLNPDKLKGICEADANPN